MEYELPFEFNYEGEEVNDEMPDEEGIRTVEGPEGTAGVAVKESPQRSSTAGSVRGRYSSWLFLALSLVVTKECAGMVFYLVDQLAQRARSADWKLAYAMNPTLPKGHAP